MLMYTCSSSTHQIRILSRQKYKILISRPVPPSWWHHGGCRCQPRPVEGARTAPQIL
jgi:hypothetical protein